MRYQAAAKNVLAARGGAVVRDDPNERLAFFRPASLPGAEVMAAYQSSEPWHMFHERYAFCVCRTAAAGVRYRGREHLVNDGSVLVREPGETHYNTFMATPAEFKTLFIEPPLFLQAARELGSRGFHFPPAPITQDQNLFYAFERLCSSIEGGGEDLEQQWLFAAAVAAIAPYAERGALRAELRSGRLAVERAKTHLKERFNELVSLDELAAVARVSRFHLVHAFTKETGLPPHAYQMHIRVERARGLLQRGISVTRAAASVGFADQSHLTRCFKRILRVTPNDYARATARSSIGKFLASPLTQPLPSTTAQAP
jgi:AraC-like DNA-binding protein